MRQNFISNSTESVRMFKSDLLEACSKVSFYVPLLVYIPYLIFLAWKCLFQMEMSVANYIIYNFVGLAFWTFAEYILHRFVFHFVPKSKIGLRIHFIFHGVHHDYPRDAKRLVMPPSASIPMALIIYFLFSLVIPFDILQPFFSGFLVGYLIYDMMHYALHHANFKNKWWKELKKHHMLHHYDEPDKGYGVSSTIWDKIFRSTFTKKVDIKKE